MTAQVEPVDPLPEFPSLRHGLAIGKMLNLASAAYSEFPPSSAIENMLEKVAACHAFIDTDVTPFMNIGAQTIPIQTVRYFIQNDGWGRSREINDLFAAYVKAGHIKVDEPQVVADPLPADWYQNGALPLEAAIILGNLSAFDALLANGADINKVPCKVSEKPKSKPFLKTPCVDIFTFISAHLSAPLATTMTSRVKETIMRRRISLIESTMKDQIAQAIVEPTSLPILPTPESGARHRMGKI